jgi:hypothetical protein
MILSNGITISVHDCYGQRDDVSFIDQFEWKNSDHMKVAIQMWLASRLAAVSGESASTRARNDQLAQDEIDQIRMRLASNPKSPPAVLVYLAKGAEPKLSERIAENPQSPPELLYELATNDVSDVRQAVADNPNTPRFVLEMLMTDENPDVRYRLAENPALPMDFLTRLCAEDSHPYVAARASATLARLSCGRVFMGDFQERSRARRDVVAIR